MCGIAGIVDKRGKLGPARLGQLAKEAADRMRHRGPDNSGVWVSPDGRCALSHRRLSIIDVSSAGHQPMVSRTGHSVIAFNGEVYNFLELKGELEARGAAFRSNSDTEVLLEMLEQRGPRGAGAARCDVCLGPLRHRPSGAIAGSGHLRGETTLLR